MYCPSDYSYLGSGFSAATCQATCVGLCTNVFLSADGRGDCYTCASGADNWQPNSDYTLYSKSVAAVDVVMKQPCMWNLVNTPWHPIGGTPPVTVENVREHLKTRGDFYYDLAGGELLYFPHLDQNMTALTTEAVVASEETIVLMNGTARHAWQDVVFEYATWLRPMEGEGFVEAQSAACSVCPVGEKMKPREPLFSH